MVVQTRERQPGHGGAVGLHVGELNVQLHFPREISHVELELDHLRIACDLEPSFWEDQPEIHDHRLSCWLESKRLSGKLPRRDALVALIPSGEHCFKLQMISQEEAKMQLEGPQATAYFSPVTSPAVLLERRRHSTGVKVDRRRTARAKAS